jgi:hypothetical protein
MPRSKVLALRNSLMADEPTRGEIRPVARDRKQDDHPYRQVLVAGREIDRPALAAPTRTIFRVVECIPGRLMGGAGPWLPEIPNCLR